MSKQVIFKLNLAGLNELMKSAEMKAHLEECGGTVASIAGEEYDHRVHDADFVSIANVFPNSEDAAQDNYDNNTLLKALGTAGLNMSKGGGG